MEAKADILFETSWEVCNKVGGIYTVITSKASKINEFYNNYYFIGPYFAKQTSGQFIEEAPPQEIKDVIDRLKNEGIFVHYGTWLIPTNPKTFLIDHNGIWDKTDEIKKFLWETFGIDSYKARHDFDEPAVWSYAVARLIQELAQSAFQDKTMVAQFHEWMAGIALLYLRNNNVKVGTIFTTHATMLGRTLASNNVDIYQKLSEIDPQKEAYDHNIQEKFLTEQQCAKYSDSFTTVSEITGIEAEHFLGNKPDVILPNGLDIEKFPSFEDSSIKHKMFKQKIREYIMAHFFPYYSFDITKTLIFFIAGRYEFHTKGIDIYINALAKLNEYMKHQNINRTVVAFLFVPGDIKSVKFEVIEGQSYLTDIKDYLFNDMTNIKNNLLYKTLAQEPISEDTLFDAEYKEESKRRVLRFKKEGTPPICSHDLNNEDKDPIIRNLKKANLNNTKEDKVKVIFYPIYLSGADGLLNTNYYETMTGAHLGVFPSYYEPWGYTPLEAGALGIAAITTDLSGFGMYVKSEVEGKDKPGIWVLDRLGKDDEYVTENLSEVFKKYIYLHKHDRIENKINARKIASKADWKNLVVEYIKAHNLALENINER